MNRTIKSQCWLIELEVSLRRAAHRDLPKRRVAYLAPSSGFGHYTEAARSSVSVPRDIRG